MLPARADADALKRHVIALSQTFSPRDFQHLDNLEKVAVYIESHFKQYTSRVESQSVVSNEVKTRNVIAHFGPTEGPVLVIGAHYDSYDALPAADDNASGAAGLLELARLLQAHPPAIAVQLVAYTLEEPPFFRSRQMGSYVHAESLHARQTRVHLMMSLEMIGYFSDQPKSQTYPSILLSWFYPSKGNFISVVGKWSQGKWTRRVRAVMRNATPLPVRSVSAPAIMPGIDFSDHLNYWAFGYPAVMITDTAFCRNTAYHTTLDTADRLDYARMADVVNGVFAYALTATSG